MSSQLPKTLKNYTLFVDGIGYAGRVTEGKPPKLSLRTEDFSAGGLAGPVPIDTGEVEKLESTFTVAEYNPELHALLGKADTLCTLRAAQGEAGAEEPVIYQMRGPIHSVDPQAFGRGGQKGIQLTVHPRMVKVTIAGREVVHIDLERNIRAIGGTDQMAGIRTALGV